MASHPATLPPWLSSWASAAGGTVLYAPASHKLKALEYYRALARERLRQRSRLTVYTFGKDDSQILRVGGWSGRGSPSVERYPLDQYPLLERYPLDPLAGPAPPDLAHLPGVQWAPAARATSARGGGAGGAAARGWLAGAAVLVLLAVLVRALEKCLDLKFISSRRRSQEWTTPHVRAVNHMTMDDGTVMIPGLEDAEPLPADLSDATDADLPPPYSECVNIVAGCSKPPADIMHEEPPPPYSDTYVEFSNKNGVPSVLIFSRKRTPLVNRRDVGGSEELPDETINEPNVESANAEVANETAVHDGNDNVNGADASDDDAANVITTSNAGNTDGKPIKSSYETTIDIGEDTDTQGAVIV